MRASGHDYGDDGGSGESPSQTRSHCCSCGELAENGCVPARMCRHYRGHHVLGAKASLLEQKPKKREKRVENKPTEQGKNKKWTGNDERERISDF